MLEFIQIEQGSVAPDEKCLEIHEQTIGYYSVIGFVKPWISYYLKAENDIVGICSFKGKPDAQKKVEIAYYTFEPFEGKGYGTEMCSFLTDIAKKAGDVIITARTLPEENASTSILKKCGYSVVGTIDDIDDGEVWEWQII